MLYFLCCVMGSLAAGLAEQNENVGSDQASTVVNYADVRARLANSLPEKANEIADLVDNLQELSRATTEVADKISAHCSK